MKKGEEGKGALELFEVLERRLEQVLDQFQTLKKDNATFQKQLEEKDLALMEVKETIDRMTKERELVRDRIDQLLNKLEILGVDG